MAAPIGPGDFIEFCGPTAKSDGAVVVGGIYQAGEFAQPTSDKCGFCGSRAPGFFLRGEEWVLGDDGWYSVWCPCRWKPIYRPRADFIEALKAPPKRAPVRTSEPA